MKWNLYQKWFSLLRKEVDEDDTYAAPYKTLGSRCMAAIADVITVIMQQRESGKDIEVMQWRPCEGM